MVLLLWFCCCAGDSNFVLMVVIEKVGCVTDEHDDDSGVDGEYGDNV